MILTTLLFGATLLIAGGILKEFWEDIFNWLKRAVDKVTEVIVGVVYGCTIFIKKLLDGAQEISKHYSKNNDEKWEETVVTRQISEDQVPQEIRKKAVYNKEVDFTKELELKLA